MRAVVRPGVAAAWLLAALLTSGNALAASPTALDVTPSLLTADDLPAGMVSIGIDDPPRFDVDAAAYDAHGGRAAMNQIWQSSTLDSRKGVAFLIDFRILFPTPEDAEAYLADGEDILSEANASHLALVEGEAPIGEGLRHYAGQGETSGLTLQFDNYLYRVGPVAVKLFIGAFDRDAEGYARIAQAGADRITVALLAAAVPSLSPGPAASDSPGTIRQWAQSATASSQYGASDWSAAQATGSPDTTEYADRPTAWAPASSDAGLEWLELTYEHAVVPTAVAVHETSASGFVTRIDALPEGSETWTTLWQGKDPSPDELSTFMPTLTPAEIVTRVLRVTIDTRVPGWNEIDAVELIGTAAP